MGTTVAIGGAQQGVWLRAGLPTFAPVVPRLPLTEQAMVQLAPGRLEADAALLSAADVLLYRSRVNVRAVVSLVLERGYAAFVLPVAWAGTLTVNGEAARSSSMYLFADQAGIVYGGDPRQTVSVMLPRDRLVETVAALVGACPEDVPLRERRLELTPATAARARRRLGALLDGHRRGDGGTGARPGPAEVADEILEVVVDAYLGARPEGPPHAGNGWCPTRIVRRAEERFAAAQGTAISLADLCAAAGVGKSSLYLAFHAVTGGPPLDYFRKRRLTQTREALLAARPEPAAVKRAALDAGFTELGRFSVEYRRLFGESPSVTLRTVGTS